MRWLPILGYQQWSEFGKWNGGYRDLAPVEKERTQRSSGEMRGIEAKLLSWRGSDNFPKGGGF